jgi:hypothetical protein
VSMRHSLCFLGEVNFHIKICDVLFQGCDVVVLQKMHRRHDYLKQELCARRVSSATVPLVRREKHAGRHVHPVFP